MADEIDAAQEEIARMQELSLQTARMGLGRLKPTGHCYNCEEPLKRPDQLFCDMDCAQDYERREWAAKMRG